MTLLKVGSSVINTEYIAHVDLETSDDVIVYLKHFESNRFTDRLEYNDNYPELDLKELKFSGKEAEALKHYFNTSRQEI